MTNKYTVIAPVGKKIEDIFVGIKEFTTERVILLATDEMIDLAKKTQKDLERFKIPTTIKEVKGHTWESTFKAVAEIKSIEKNSNLILNVSTGNIDTRCAATSAAFVNGIKAFSVDNNEINVLPVLKFSYYKMITDQKMDLLKFLFSKKDCCASLEDLSKRTGMSLPLVSYHINGNLKSEGLKDLGLVETMKEKGRTRIVLSMLGRLLVKGYVK
jgi:DNA-binding transcriptional ArsR family regulator